MTLRQRLRRSFSVSISATAAPGPVTAAYFGRLDSGAVRRDDEQLALAARLDALHASLAASETHFLPDCQLDAAAQLCSSSSFSAKPWFHPSRVLASPPESLYGARALAWQSLYQKVASVLSTYRPNEYPPPPRGLYVHGSVGVGKSFLMDLFYDVCGGTHKGRNTSNEHREATIQRRCRRAHFHEFMLDVHGRIHEHKRSHPRSDPIPPVAASLAREARLLCFDEFQVTDIADAMLIRRLFTLLFDLGVVVVATSNRPPELLYEGGLNRSLFLPFVDTLRGRLDVVAMGSVYDYRRDRANATSTSMVTDGIIHDALPSYVWPSDDPDACRLLADHFRMGGGPERVEDIPVLMGRTIHVPRANDGCGWFHFDNLCRLPLGAADYLALASRFHTVIVDCVPQLGGDTYNEARRFVTLIDALYEAKTKLVIAATVPRESLFVGFDAEVESRDGDEEMAVIGKGGSSSAFATTVIRSKEGRDMEWSATGRIGVSLAQLSAVKEVSFAFRRAESRLAEMSGLQWGRHHR